MTVLTEYFILADETPSAYLSCHNIFKNLYLASNF